MTKTILCVEDELDILQNNSDILIKNGYKVLTAENLSQARKHMANSASIDAIVLDIMLPDGNGLDYLQELRTQSCAVPVIMLTAWNRSDNIAHGLDLGADDYIGKPFEYEVLLARLRKVLAGAERLPETVKRGALTLKITSDEAFVNGENLFLSQKEFSLLYIFIMNEGKTMSAEHLYEKVWGQSMLGNKSAVKKAVSRLRIKLIDSGYTVSTKRGEGYYFARMQ